MTEKHKNAIRRGLKKARERRRKSAAMIESWKRRRTLPEHVRVSNEAMDAARNNEHTPSVNVPHSTTKMTPEQLIADICKIHELPFTFGDLDHLVTLCEVYVERQSEVTKP